MPFPENARSNPSGGPRTNEGVGRPAGSAHHLTNPHTTNVVRPQYPASIINHPPPHPSIAQHLAPSLIHTQRHRHIQVATVTEYSHDEPVARLLAFDDLEQLVASGYVPSVHSDDEISVIAVQVCLV